MSKKLTVLIYGSGNVGPINILLKNLKTYGAVEYDFRGLNLHEDRTIQLSHYNQFDQIYKIGQTSSSKISKRFLKRYFIHFFHRQQLSFCAKALIRFKLKSCLRYLKSDIIYHHFQEEHNQLFNAHPIINVHFINPERAKVIVNAPKTCKIILSFWGSDLMASAGPDNYVSVYKAVERADLITMHSIEMREIFLSKFGRRFQSKVRLALFGQKDEVFAISEERAAALHLLGNSIIKKHGIDPNKFAFKFKVGYSGFESQNHLRILEQCAKLDSHLKENSLFIIPMTYGRNDDYTYRVSAYAAETGLNVCLIKNYMTDEEALSISYVSQIMFNLRDNDAFNNSMMETLISGNILISGGWLPYSELRKARVHFHEIFQFEHLPHLISTICGQMQDELLKCRQNFEIVRGIVSGAATAPKWESIYHEVIEN